MDHLKEIKSILAKSTPIGYWEPNRGEIVFLKPDPTVALFEAQQAIEYLNKRIYDLALENSTLQLRMMEHRNQCAARIRESEQDAHNRVKLVEREAQKTIDEANRLADERVRRAYVEAEAPRLNRVIERLRCDRGLRVHNIVSIDYTPDGIDIYV